MLCHNFEGYVSIPILQYLYRNGVKPTIIPNDGKHMPIEVPRCKIRMIDSLNVLPTALSKLPKMFGFTELHKGYVPHLDNSKEHKDIKLQHLSNIRYYNPDAMMPPERYSFKT